jgi:hypothetical protein
MKRLLKWLLPLLVLIEFILIRLGVVDFGSAVAIGLLFELLIVAVLGRQLISAARAFDRNRREGRDEWMALAGGLEVFMPYGAARAFTIEFQLWYYLGKWLLHRNKAGEGEFTYHKKSILLAFTIILLFVTPAEVFILGLILPWVWLKWLLSVASVYAFFWVVAVHASMVGRPHRLGESALLVRYGVLAGGEIPYGNIETVVTARTKNGPSGDGLRVVEAEKAAYFSIGGETSIKLLLREPVRLDNWIKKTGPVSTVYIAADDPEKLAAALEKRLTSNHPKV